MSDVATKVSREPYTIWAVEEHQRPETVIALVKGYASQFHKATRQKDSDAAQDCVIAALGAIAGLFPPDDEAAHEFLLSIVGVFMGAKAGRKSHILLKRTDSMPGIKRGFGHTNVAGFAIAAVEILTDRHLVSDRAARQHVATWLADAGLSLRKGDHEEPKPVTESAVREWFDCPEKFPTSHAIAADMRIILEGHLAKMQCSTLADVSALLANEAKQALRRTQLL